MLTAGQGLAVAGAARRAAKKGGAVRTHCKGVGVRAVAWWVVIYLLFVSCLHRMVCTRGKGGRTCVRWTAAFVCPASSCLQFRWYGTNS